MPTSAPSQELSSWKEISAYLGVSVKTAQLWEQQRGLPVHRLPGPRGRVYATAEELDRWKGSGTTSTVSSHTRKFVLAGLVVMAVAVGLGLRQMRVANLVLEDVRPLTSMPGLELHPSISPDATQFAFLRIAPGGNPELCIQEFSTGTIQVVDTVLPGTHARWSPDASLLAYAKAAAGGAAIIVRDKNNQRRTLTTLLGEDRKTEMLNALILDWLGPKELVVSDRAGSGQPLALVGVDAVSGQRRQLTSPKSGPGDVQPAARGQFLAFARYSSHSEGDVYWMDLRSGAERRITRNHARIDGIAWTPDAGGLVIGSTSGGPEVSLYHLTLEGKMSRLSGVEGSANFPSLSKSKLLFQSQIRDTNIWEYAETVQPLASSTRMEFGPAYGPDRRSVAFISKRSGSSELWLQTDKATLQLTKLGQHYTDAPRWSPDGRTIAFTSQQEGNRDIYLVDIATTAVRRFTTGASEEGRASFSRDGRSIYFRSNRSGSDQIWKQAIEGEAMQVTKGGGFEAFESADGTNLYYIKARNREELWQMPPNGGAEVLAHQSVGEGRWSIADDGIYILRPTDPPTILRWNPVSNQESSVFTLPAVRRLEAGFTISKDGKRMAWSQVDRHEADLLQAIVAEK